MEEIINALMYPFSKHPDLETGVPSLFLNGVYSDLLPEDMIVQQYQKYMQKNKMVPEIPDEKFEMIFLQSSKNKIETRYLVGRALQSLSEKGLLVCAGRNDFGGKALKKDLVSLGFQTRSEAKYKHQIIWLFPKGKQAEDWVEAGRVQPVLEGAYYSQPGIFGWDKIDAGSRILVNAIPDGSLEGKGADFGCGYGYIAQHVLQNNSGVNAFICADSDYRAINCCSKNLSGYTDVEYVWSNLTDVENIKFDLDFIVMNPPFHVHKDSRYSVGEKFIESAAKCLKRKGDLWMVANSHLPYEKKLSGFFDCRKIEEKEGFKVYHAVRK
jgi:16S rRNA (guanine1207-N2)-methyltransferase